MSAFDAVRAARPMWQALETVHAIVYFAPEVIDRYRRLGLKGFWMGYFSGRAAPLGPASPEMVTALFFNFHSSMVARALPDAWGIASPADIIDARFAALDEVLRRVLPVDDMQKDIGLAAGLLEEAVAGCSVAGRGLYAAHRAIPWPEPPHLRLWHGATLLREHRGDGHVAANLAHGFDGLAAHLMLCASGTAPREAIQPHRGWSDGDWEDRHRSLVDEGLLTDAGVLTELGRIRRQAVETTTDRLAAEPWRHLGEAATGRLEQLLQPVAGAIVASGLIPFPNPMGLPPPPSG